MGVVTTKISDGRVFIARPYTSQSRSIRTVSSAKIQTSDLRQVGITVRKAQSSRSPHSPCAGPLPSRIEPTSPSSPPSCPRPAPARGASLQPCTRLRVEKQGRPRVTAPRGDDGLRHGFQIVENQPISAVQVEGFVLLEYWPDLRPDRSYRSMNVVSSQFVQKRAASCEDACSRAREAAPCDPRNGEFLPEAP